jgi:hypothetical protein
MIDAIHRKSSFNIIHFDFAYLEHWANELGLLELLNQVLSESGIK